MALYGLIQSEMFGMMSDMSADHQPKAKRSHPKPEQGLTARERETLLYVSEGMTTADIAARLQLSAEIIDTDRRTIIRKLGVANLAHAVGHSLRNKIIE